MPKFLNHLDLNGNQLKNTKLEITDSPLAEEGVIHYHDTNNTVRYHDGTGFVTLGDNDVATSTAAGVVELFSDTTQTVAANSVSTTSSRTYGVQLNSDDQMVVNVPWSDTTIANTNTQNTTTLSFVDSTNDILIRNTTGGAGSGTDDIKIVAGTNITLTHTDADNFTISSTDTNTQNDASTIRTLVGTGNSGVVPAAPSTGSSTKFLRGDGTFVVPSYIADTNLDNAGVIAKVLTGLSTATGGAVDATDSILVGFGKLEKRVALNDAKVTNSQVSTDVTLASVSSNYLSISGQAITAGTVPISLGGTGQTTASAAADALLNISHGGALSIGDASDTITIAGNLTVTGAQTTTLSNTVKTGDNMLELNTNATGHSTDFGWYGKFVDTTTQYAGMNWDASDNKFKIGSGNDVPAGTIDWDTAGTLVATLEGNADTVTNATFTTALTVNTGAVTLTGASGGSTLTIGTTASISGTNTGDGTYGIADTNFVKIDSSSVADDEYARFTANGLESRTNGEVLSDIGAVAANSAITAATKAKITFDAKGLVTGGANLASADIPNNAANTSGSSGSCTGNAATATAIADGGVGGVKVFELTHVGSGSGQVAGNSGSASSDSHTWTITHGMGSGRFYKVEVVLDSGDYDTVYVDVQRPSDTTVKITFGAAVANGAYRAMVTRMA